jgi:hypothetical protein
VTGSALAAGLSLLLRFKMGLRLSPQSALTCSYAIAPRQWQFLHCIFVSGMKNHPPSDLLTITGDLGSNPSVASIDFPTQSNSPTTKNGNPQQNQICLKYFSEKQI